MQNYIKCLLSLLVIIGYNDPCTAQQNNNINQQTFVIHQIQTTNKSNAIKTQAQLYENKQYISINNQAKPGKLDQSKINMFNSNANKTKQQLQTPQVATSPKIQAKYQMYANKKTVLGNNTTQQNKLDQSRIKQFESKQQYIPNEATNASLPYVNASQVTSGPVNNAIVPNNSAAQAINTLINSNINNTTVVKPSANQPIITPTIQQTNTQSPTVVNNTKQPNINQIQNAKLPNINNIQKPITKSNNNTIGNNINQSSTAVIKTRELNSIAKELENNIISIKQQMIKTFGAIHGGVFGGYNSQLLNQIEQSHYKILHTRSIRQNELQNHLIACSSLGIELVKYFNTYIKNCNTHTNTLSSGQITEYNALMTLVKQTANTLYTRINTVCNI